MRLLFLVCLQSLLTAVPPPIEHLECAKATGPITVDGRLDEAAWKAIPPVTDFRLWQTFGHPTEKTEFRICYDDHYLYASFVCDDKDIFTLYDQRDAHLWESDAVELFLKPDAGNPIYYEFEIAPNNAIFDARMVNTGSGGFQRWAAWNSDIKTAVHLDGTLNEWKDRDKGYAVELAIPLDTFREVIGDKPLKGQVWKVAAVRVDFSVTLTVEERSSTANVPDMNIHKKDGYATLTFK